MDIEQSLEEHAEDMRCLVSCPERQRHHGQDRLVAKVRAEPDVMYIT